MTNQRVRDLATLPIGRLLLKYGWPSLVAMAVNALYSVVDRIYIGQGCGTDAMAALALVFPIMIALSAFGVFVGAGHGALISIKLGEKDRIACEKLLGELVALKLLFFLTLIPLLYVFLEPVLLAIGGAKVSPLALAQAETYMRIVLFSHFFSHLAFGLSATMRAEGAAAQSMISMVVGFGLNFFLDPLFIFVFDMGIAGAAWATVVGMTASAAVAFWFYSSGRSAVRFRLRRIWIYRQFIVRAAGIGFGPFLQQLLGAFINVSLQIGLVKWALDDVAATAELTALGVFQTSLIMVVVFAMGIQMAMSPIIGYNWGARNYDRVREAVVKGFWLTTAVVASGSALLVLAPDFVMRIFIGQTDEATAAVTRKALVWGNCLLWCIGLNVTATTFFQAIGHPKTAIVLSTLRQGVCFLPCIWILPYFFADHALGVWLATPASDLMAFVATAPVAFTYLRFLSKAGASRGRRNPGAS